jgi:predicted nucleic-acid-binding protein
LERHEIVQALGRLLNTHGVCVQSEASLRRALHAYADSSADFADHVILEVARDEGALPVATFDRRFARQADVIAVPE